MRTPLLPLALFAAAAGLMTAAAQQPPVAVAPEPRPARAEVAVAPEPREVKAVAKGEGPKESPRLVRLKQLTFDRRPSAILKAWAPAKPGLTRPRPGGRSPNMPPGAVMGPDGPDSPGGPGGPGGSGGPPPGGLTPAEAAALEELAAFQKKVTLGDWAGVKAYLAGLPDEEATPAYRQLLRSLQQPANLSAGGPPPPGLTEQDVQMLQQMQGQRGQQFAERHVFTADDLFGLAAAAPTAPNPAHFPGRVAAVGGPSAAAVSPPGLDRENLNALANVFRETTAGGTLVEVLITRFKADVAKPDGQRVFGRRQVAKLLILSGEAAYAGDFLPTPEQAIKDLDAEGLNLLAKHFVVLHAKEAKGGNLEKAWAAVQAVLANPLNDPEEKEEALVRAVELAPRLKDAYGQEWLDASFTKNPDRGMEILAAIGTAAARGLATRPHQIDERLNTLKLMKTAVEALLKAAPEKAKTWQPTLTLLALGWMREAEFSQRFDTSSGSRLRRDRYGNMYMFDDDDFMMQQRMMMQPNMPRPILVADVMKAAPDPTWVAAIDPSLRPKLAGIAARMHLKVEEDEKAFPLIEQTAAAQPNEAKELVKEFLQVWTRNHDPNAARNRYRYSWYFFAFEQRAEGIPLTRSKQERNLVELSKWAKRIRALPAGAADVEDAILVKAFTACHSSAEVYRTEAIEAVFGPMGGLKPKTVAALAEQMRGNLAGQWKDPAEQQNKKTNRKKKDIEQEVLRGYQVARGAVADATKKFPGHWALLTAAAGLAHDEAGFRSELQKSADFSARRNEAFALYQAAAADYARAVRTLPEDEQTTDLYEQWFAAGLGAVDLGMISEDKQPDWRQPPLIRKAIEGLPGDLAEKHLGKFATNLFVKMSGAKPHVKFNYLKAGFQVVGDHKNAAEAKKVFDYYKDLVTEIRLEALVDGRNGSTRVGHGRPFGLFVNIAHTRDIERESGGFGRYLQNQNAGGFFSYNYGRPTTDYRDRFETAARAALKDHFEVLSVSFQDDKVHSRAAKEFGWRYTPYAYLLLKPKGPQVDKVPPLRLDLDFLDTSGFVVMPVETPAVPIDCKDPSGDSRPVDQLVVTQTLDERQADKGVLILEIKAIGQGLVPSLDELIDPKFDGFEVTKTEAPEVGVKKFEEDADRNVIVSERGVTLTLTAKDGQTTLPTAFRFPDVKVPTKETVHQRYNDADLVTVGQDVSLERTYGTASKRGVYRLAAGAVVVLGLVGGLIYWLTRKAPTLGGPGLPDDPDAFTAAAVLRDIRDRSELSAAQRAALDQDLAAVEQYYYAADRNGSPAPDLCGLVRKWAAAVPGYRPAGTPRPVGVG
ncbi:MAG: hypothetical protein K2X87_23105 [Gemmataceae bacterium]|nr:hypothetical protein [Gemmataceae bacterium]